MKRILIVLVLAFLTVLSAFSVRVFTSFDIAGWFLDADLVLICSVHHIDTIYLSHFDSLANDGMHVRYDLVKERYQIDVDSILKPDKDQLISFDTIFSQEFSINNYEGKETKEVLYPFDINGDTIGTDTVGRIEMTMNHYSDDTYFRLQQGEKYVVILSLGQNRYFIDYGIEVNDSILRLIEEAKTKGKSFFPHVPDG
ncbi:hypothetical protein ACE01N_07415 [Saccharicrinis sp. FJH2]|uniref:hypothetical protein n=1 Tax=Saccharicrinis sp. FJH65 TaxID=3344659 RepID=UPI0035F3689C